MGLLTEAQLVEVCRGFVKGKVTSTMLIDKFYQELSDADALPTGKSKYEIRCMLSNEICTAKPSSARFRKTKYGGIVETEIQVGNVGKCR